MAQAQFATNKGSASSSMGRNSKYAFQVGPKTLKGVYISARNGTLGQNETQKNEDNWSFIHKIQNQFLDIFLEQVESWNLQPGEKRILAEFKIGEMTCAIWVKNMETNEDTDRLF